MSITLATFLLWPPAAKPRTVTWEELLLPLFPGALVTRGYTLSSPRRGEEHDVVFTARRDDIARGPLAHVEVHIVNKGQWPDIRETKSFGVAYETPRSNAPLEDLEAVTETIATRLRSNDTGFTSVDGIPLAAEPPAPWMTRMYEHLRGWRAAVVIVLWMIALGFVSSIKRQGDLLAALILLVLGLGLRLPNLDLPFVHDQDVQRFFTGQYPLVEILTGNGLDDRHPPLWFVVLHVAGLFGQTEDVARFPAALSGAFIGPAIVWAAYVVRGRAGIAAAWCGLAATISPELIRRSREVSEIPFFSVLVIVVIALTLRLSQRSSGRTKYALVVVTGLLAWTYYLAPLVVLAIVVALVATRRIERNVLVALGLGCIVGAPAFLLGAWTIVRDRGAREVAAQYPGLAWGERSSGETLLEIAHQTRDAVGAPMILLSLLAGVFALLRRRDPSSFVALAVMFTTAIGIAFAAQFARVQPYYIIAIVPVLLLAAALGPSSRASVRPAWWMVCAASIVPYGYFSLPNAGVLHVRDLDAFMPTFASFVLQRSESRVIVVAHYDATLLTYYVERQMGARAVWPASDASGEFVLPTSGKRVLTLAQVHDLRERSDEEAEARLRVALEKGPALVIERDAFVLERVHRELAACTILLVAPSARL
ncbi:MAG TPA: hypothetical protein PK156_49440, partial [Polyangium sp.]|nr:hypothetical protein [Polyangium sp.]